jgi:hypothetical protein
MGPSWPYPLVAQVSSTRRGADAPLTLIDPPIPFLSRPDSGFHFNALLEATKARTGVRSRQTPYARTPTPKAFHPVMPDELSKWPSFFTRLLAHHVFG